MLFTSTAFLIFLPIVFALYWGRNNIRYQNLLLLVSSYVFYGWWNWKFLGLLLLSTLIDYFFGFWVAEGSPGRRKLFLMLSILNNLLVLCIFKYYNFFIQEAQHFLDHTGWHIHPYVIKVVLPVGISFYTFHGMSYVIDIYRGHFKPVRSFGDYAVFVSFFPLLVAGPIERATNLLPQIQRPRVFQYEQAVQGMRLMLWGFFKKMVIANWTYIVWGGIHAVGFLPLLLLGSHRKYSKEIVAADSRLPTFRELMSMSCTFVFVTLAWIYFRSATLGSAFGYLTAMRYGLLTRPAYLSFLFLYVIPFVLLDWNFRRHERDLNIAPGRYKYARYVFYTLMAYISIAHSGSGSSFIYFQF